MRFISDIDLDQTERESEDSERGRLEKWRNELNKQKLKQKKDQRVYITLRYF